MSEEELAAAMHDAPLHWAENYRQLEELAKEAFVIIARAHPDAMITGTRVHNWRMKLGALLQEVSDE